MRPGEYAALAQEAQEKRILPRAKVNLPAKIVFLGKDYVLDCTIRDLSASGARVAVPDIDIVPTYLILIEPKNLLAFDSYVRWRRKNLAGLSFNKIILLDDRLDSEYQALRMHALNARAAWGY